MVGARQTSHGTVPATVPRSKPATVRYREQIRYLERRCDYMSKDDPDLIPGGNLDAVFDAYDRGR